MLLPSCKKRAFLLSDRYVTIMHYNLSLGKSTNVQSVRNVVGIIKEVHAFFSASAERNFINRMEEMLGGRISGLWETRWIERHEAFTEFCVSFPKIIAALEKTSQ